jgi:pyruvate dehydrogenase phosphatase
MPSRSIGDFRLKHREFNFHQFNRELGYRLPIPNYTGPYITHTPDVQVFELKKEDRFLVLATDGLWDEIKRKQSG